MIVLLDNSRQAVEEEIGRHLKNAQRAFFVAAFIRDSAIKPLEGALRDFLIRDGQLSVLFGNAFGITEATAIRRLQRLGVELRYHRGVETFNPKGYLFESSATTISAIVGSSSICASGLTCGVEWNVLLESSDCALRPVVEAVRQLWNSPDSAPVTDAVLDKLHLAP